MKGIESLPSLEEGSGIAQVCDAVNLDPSPSGGDQDAEKDCGR
jgi:hypothetical protein